MMGPNLPHPNFPGAPFAGAQFAAKGPNLPGPDLPPTKFPGPNLPHPKFSGAQFAATKFPRGPICRQGAQSAGARFAKKWQIGPQKVRGPICRQIGEGPNLPGPNLPGPNLPRTETIEGPTKYRRIQLASIVAWYRYADMLPGSRSMAYGKLHGLWICFIL